ncbi:MAG: UDP-N-acetylglucosamine 2-epimerase (non-hydrolyzing) [Chloracidobacterium sp.]|nr:UDP-N-acetylglucosamine 2-epimerase (non-hydrolyzing) [Chloracidobacterium sp.]
MLVTVVAGARPNFMKISPLIKAIRAARLGGEEIDFRLVHTGQHFDQKMSGEFFEQLGIPEPDINLECGGGSQAEQTAAVLVAFERELQANPPSVVVVVGDVTSTMACTIAAKKLCVPVVHVEAGIRSGDMTMPEEVNRIVTDSICDHFFTTSRHANRLLEKNGVDQGRIHFVGNTMIDSLYQNLERLKKPGLWDIHGLKNGGYFLLTLHRPANVDDPEKLTSYLDAILDGTKGFPVVFPVHPRTRKTLEGFGYQNERLLQTDPLGYLEFIYLLKYAMAVITDSGGITEEATVLNVPCMTLRDSTERPETVDIGTNELVGTDPALLKPYLESVVKGSWKQGSIPEFWDGKTSERIVDVLLRTYGSVDTGLYTAEAPRELLPAERV